MSQTLDKHAARKANMLLQTGNRPATEGQGPTDSLPHSTEAADWGSESVIGGCRKNKWTSLRNRNMCGTLLSFHQNAPLTPCPLPPAASGAERVFCFHGSTADYRDYVPNPLCHLASSRFLSTEHLAGKQRQEGRRRRRTAVATCVTSVTQLWTLQTSVHRGGISLAFIVTVPCARTAENLTLTWMFADREACQIWFLGQPDDDADDDTRLHFWLSFHFKGTEAEGRNARHRSRLNRRARSRFN